MKCRIPSTESCAYERNYQDVRPVVLLMTATITPPVNCPNLARVDPAVRINDYCNALKFYLDVPNKYIDRIIFAENSDSDLTPLKNELANNNLLKKEVEFISYSGGNAFPPEYGKGYGEMLLIDFALDNSKIISKEDIIWKATGRLVLSNISKLIAGTAQGYNLYCDLHNEYKLLSLTRFFDPRFYSFTLEGYDLYFRPYTPSLKSQHIEHFFYDKLINRIASDLIIPRFLYTPIINGYLGATNNDYWSPRKRIQRKFQQFIRLIAPGFWI